MQPKHLAIALTLMEGDKYRAFLPADYILHLRRETGNRVEAAKKVIKKFNCGSNIPSFVPRASTKETRTLVFFVNTGQVSLYHYTQVVYTKQLLHHCVKECLKMRNFASVAAIATAFAIRDHPRSLKTTLGQLTSRQRQSMDGLINIINPAYKYQAYHRSLGQPAQLFEREQCVPWIVRPEMFLVYPIGHRLDVHNPDLGSVLQNIQLTIEREGAHAH